MLAKKNIQPVEAPTWAAIKEKHQNGMFDVKIKKEIIQATVWGFIEPEKRGGKHVVCLTLWETPKSKNLFVRF
jgi:hypothetical protein